MSLRRLAEVKKLLRGLLRRGTASHDSNSGGGYGVFLTEQAKDINEARLRHLASLGLDIRGKRVLEVGAGIGLHTAFFEELGCTVLCTDGRKENVKELHRRHPNRKARVFDLDAIGAVESLGLFDVVYCYGTLYHLQRPDEAIRRLASMCRELFLLETMVLPETGSSIQFVSEDAATVNQAMGGQGCRPTRQWVMERLRLHFGYAYITRTQPLHPEFHLDWSRPILGKNHRAIFVASKTPLQNHRLSDALLERQTYDIDHPEEVWIDVGAHLGELSFQRAREAPWRVVYAFEPNLRLASRLFARLPNYIVVPMAVSTRDGFAEFHLNVSDVASSLQPFRSAGLQGWIGQEGLRIETSAVVPTIRLDTFLQHMGIARVQNLKVSAQGADYDVVLSLGKRLRDVERIQLEVAITPQQLYEASHTKDEVIAFFAREGFRLAGLERQGHDQEENLSFERIDQATWQAKRDPAPQR
jgi:FkbM family methyltransferase